MWQALMNFMLICTGNLGTDDRKYIGLHGRSVVLGDPTGLYPYGMDPIKVFIIMV